MGDRVSEPEQRRVDPDVDLAVPADRSELAAHPAAVLAAVSAGGVLGALARAGLSAALPHDPAGFPWPTFAVNLSGCLLIGVLMAVLAGRTGNSALTRPFLGVGVLGGYTTFATHTVEARQLAATGAATTAMAYLVATLTGALLAVWVGYTATERLSRTAPGGPGKPEHRPVDG
ncbi:fluoride efflux transporter FluC [Salinispora arenicola]|uniref:fluoride efflux transporter FluC n=1 Tax=Salinispora arenicola TaxID=168697 RepID=UPI000517AE63|nr:CrcB family protein [Salinispora arenicola]